MHPRETPGAPRLGRGASSWARRVNDSTAEWVAALARVLTALCTAGWLACLLGIVWSPSGAVAWRWVASAAIVGLAAVACWLLGFVQLANSEWRDTDGETN